LLESDDVFGRLPRTVNNFIVTQKKI